MEQKSRGQAISGIRGGETPVLSGLVSQKNPCSCVPGVSNHDILLKQPASLSISKEVRAIFFLNTISDILLSAILFSLAELSLAAFIAPVPMVWQLGENCLARVNI